MLIRSIRVTAFFDSVVRLGGIQVNIGRNTIQVLAVAGGLGLAFDVVFREHASVVELLHDCFSYPNCEHLFEVVGVGVEEVHLRPVLINEDPLFFDALEVKSK